jgi:hypothetical protein
VGCTMRVVVGASLVMMPPLAARVATELLDRALNARHSMLLLNALPALLLVHGRNSLHGACNKIGRSFEAA